MVLLDSCFPRKGLSLPEQCRDFPGCASCPPSHPSESTRQAASQGCARHGLKGSGTKTLSWVTSSVSLWTQALEWRSASFAVLGTSRGDALGTADPCRALPSRRLCLWARGTAARCLRQRPPPQGGTACPPLEQCPRKPQRNRVTPAQPVRLNCCRRYSGHLPGSPAHPGEGSAAPWSKEAPIPPRQGGGVPPARTYTPGSSPLLPSLHSSLGTRAALPEALEASPERGQEIPFHHGCPGSA